MSEACFSRGIVVPQKLTHDEGRESNHSVRPRLQLCNDLRLPPYLPPVEEAASKLRHLRIEVLLLLECSSYLIGHSTPCPLKTCPPLGVQSGSSAFHTADPLILDIFDDHLWGVSSTQTRWPITFRFDRSGEELVARAGVSNHAHVHLQNRSRRWYEVRWRRDAKQLRAD